MSVLLLKMLKRKVEDCKESHFTIHGREVPVAKIVRFAKRREASGAKHVTFAGELNTPIEYFNTIMHSYTSLHCLSCSKRPRQEYRRAIFTKHTPRPNTACSFRRQVHR